MEFIAGNIENERDQILLNIWNDISKNYKDLDLIIGYKTPSFGKQIDETPSLIIRSKDFGVILIDFINENIVEFDEENEYWKTSDDEYISSKDLNIDLFEKELINKLKDDKTLFNIRKDSFNFSFSIKKLLVFSQNSFAEIEKINSTSEIPLSNQYLCS